MNNKTKRKLNISFSSLLYNKRFLLVFSFVISLVANCHIFASVFKAKKYSHMLMLTLQRTPNGKLSAT